MTAPEAWGNATVYGPSRIGAGTYIGDHVVIGHPGKQERGLLVSGRLHESAGSVVGKECILRAHGVLYAGAVLGDHVQTGHHWMVREATRIGDGTLVGSGVTIDDQCTIGARVSIQTGVYIPTGTRIDDDVFLGPRVCLTNDKYMGRSETGTPQLEPVLVEAGARLGANCTILPGVTIGCDALVGAGAVVTRDVARGAMVAGVPARRIGDVPPQHRLPRSNA